MALKTLINEDVLLKAISQGDEKAFAKLFYAFHNQLGKFSFSITRSRELSEEIVHDVFIKIWEDRAKLADVRKFDSYIFILTRNCTLNAIKKLDSLKKKSLEFKLFCAQSESFEKLDHEDDKYNLVENAVFKLPPRQKEVYLLKREGLKNAEIASKMDLSLNSVKKYQQLSIQNIGKFIKDKVALITLIISFYIFF